MKEKRERLLVLIDFIGTLYFLIVIILFNSMVNSLKCYADKKCVFDIEFDQILPNQSEWPTECLQNITEIASVILLLIMDRNQLELN
jgi:hypothetical protein